MEHNESYMLEVKSANNNVCEAKGFIFGFCHLSCVDFESVKKIIMMMTTGYL